MKQFPNYKIYKKNHLVFYDKFRVNRKSFRVKYNNIGIQSKNTVYLDYKQLDSGRKILKKVLRKNGDLIVKFSPWVVRNKKPVGMRMGKGKGSKREWFCPIKKGTVVYEIFCKDFFLVRKGFLKCKNKMPFISKLVKSVY